MMKLWTSGARRVLKVSKASYQNGNINMLRATSFSSIDHSPKDIHSNKVDAPFASTDPKVVVKRQTSVEDPLDDVPLHNHHKNNKDGRSTTEEAANYVADKAKRGTKGVIETAFDVGEKLAEGMEQTFGVVKETTKKVKHTVLGKYDEDGDNRGNNNGHGNNNHHHNNSENTSFSSDHGKVDKHVEDLRRKAGGYDLRRPH